jgi:hypothetical protein
VFDKISQLVTTTPQLLGILPAVLFIAAWIAPQFANPFCEWVEKLGSQLAKRKRAPILVVVGAAILLRLSFLALIPAPVPEIPDEFSYLLAADTFAHGRLTNPPHPLWIYFDTFHVNQHPTYMSKYPPAQGAVLAFGQLLGHPWIGVLLSVAFLCGAIVWALQAWLPPGWALLGGVLAIFRLAISSYWINSYWGGALAAIGGALVIGAFPRLIHFRRLRDAVILAVGASILANSRPLEGLIFCLPVAVILSIWLVRCVHQRLESLWRIASAIASVLVLCGLFMAYYNWRITGNPLLLPYSLNQQTYFSTPALVWQKLEPPMHYLNPQFDAAYNYTWRPIWQAGRPDSLAHIFRNLALDAKVFIHFFLWPELCLPFIVAPWILFDRRTRFLLIQGVICFAGFLLMSWPLLPHYAAPLTATTFVLVVQGMRHLRRWDFRGRSVGISLSRAVVVSAILLSPFNLYWFRFHPSVDDRARIAARLEALPGKHLAIVRYLPERALEGEWVYNAADIDHAKIVWAREIPGISMTPLLDYFRDRHVWVVEPGPPDSTLSSYKPSP